MTSGPPFVEAAAEGLASPAITDPAFFLEDRGRLVDRDPEVAAVLRDEPCRGEDRHRRGHVGVATALAQRQAQP
jgi:hypothetical protein